MKLGDDIYYILYYESSASWAVAFCVRKTTFSCRDELNAIKVLCTIAKLAKRLQKWISWQSKPTHTSLPFSVALQKYSIADLYEEWEFSKCNSLSLSLSLLLFAICSHLKNGKNLAEIYSKIMGDESEISTNVYKRVVSKHGFHIWASEFGLMSLRGSPLA